MIMDIEEKIRKLSPMIGDRKTNVLWNEYMVYPENRKEIEGCYANVIISYLGNVKISAF